MRYGRSVPNGSLPVFSVADEQEAKDLLTVACPTNVNRDFIAPELALEQTIENLQLFSDRLVAYHDNFIVGSGRCRCKKKK